MFRHVWPHGFVLRRCGLGRFFSEEGWRERFWEMLGQIPRESDAGERTLPNLQGEQVALRWASDPAFGFPRQPFKLYRRPRDTRYLSIQQSLVKVESGSVLEWRNFGEMYVIRFRAEPDSGQTLMVEALDRHHETITGQQIPFSANGDGEFRCPGMRALRITGKGKVGNLKGIDQFQLANQPDWELFEHVGLPFQDHQIGTPSYLPGPQGWTFLPVSGFNAAAIRLQIATWYHQNPPPTSIADFPNPGWPAPNFTAYLNYLSTGTDALLHHIQQCLLNTNDADPNRLQANFRATVNMDGITSIDGPAAAPSAVNKAHLPVVGITMLGTGSDTYAATGLGYGTLDFLPAAFAKAPVRSQRPANEQEMAYDHMVTAEFIFPRQGKMELAALAQFQPAPEVPAGLEAEKRFSNRPPGPDMTTTETVELKWYLSTFPQSYGIIASRQPHQSRVLNLDRQPAGGFEPFIPQRPENGGASPPQAAKTVFVDPSIPVPHEGSTVTRYLVAGTDVFGRWSSWSPPVAMTTLPLPVTAPGLVSAELILDENATDRSQVSARLEIVFSWDWQDRSPEHVAFAGRFVPLPPATPPVFNQSFDYGSGPLQPTVIVGFDSTGTPGITSSHAGTVTEMSETAGDPERGLYRLILDGFQQPPVTGFQCNFTQQTELNLAVYARGVERVRPTRYSDLVGPRIARALDPIPPASPSLDPKIQWTALPDATDKARGLLTWPSDPNASGYAVWQASETALLDKFGMVVDKKEKKSKRASNLKTLMDGDTHLNHIDAFSRINTEPIRDNRIELELPGSADTLFIFRVTAINKSNMESAHAKEAAFFGVPRRKEPGQPRLVLRKVKPDNAHPDGQVKVIALPTAGYPPVGYRVFRVRKKTLLTDVGLKGPAKITHNDPQWQPYTFLSREQDADGNFYHEMGKAYDDPVPTSWLPYHYQIVAIGDEDLAEGVYSGESIASSIQSITLYPASSPALVLFPAIRNRRVQLLSFSTDLPVTPSPLGEARIEVTETQPDASGNRLLSEVILSVAAHRVPEENPVFPRPFRSRGKPMSPRMVRGKPAPDGKVIFFLSLPTSVKTGFLVVRDPLQRSTQVDLQEVTGP